MAVNNLSCICLAALIKYIKKGIIGLFNPHILLDIPHCFDLSIFRALFTELLSKMLNMVLDVII